MALFANQSTSYDLALPRRDAVVILCALLGVSLVCWVYLVWLAMAMSPLSAGQVPEWDLAYFGMMFIMWLIMMVGMMLPSVTPAVLIYASVYRKSLADGAPTGPVGAFVGGYIAVWLLFSFFATLTQWLLNEAALLSPMMVSTSDELGAALLISAGIYQWLPIKNACLQQCRSPVEFLSRSWRGGVWGATKMGALHGLFCLGCCWVLMGLLFFGGVMNLLWIAGIALFVLLEKLLPFGAVAGRLMGLLMCGFGAYYLF